MANGLMDRESLSSKANTTAKTSTVQDNELASSQLTGLMSKDSPLRQRAEAEGKNYATDRGMLNSGTGAEMTFGAVVDRITPFALEDARRFGTVADNNLAFENQFRMADKTFGMQGLMQKDDQQWRSGENAADRDFTAGENNLNRQHDLDMQQNDQNFNMDYLDKQQDFTSGENALDRDHDLSIEDKRLQVEMKKFETQLKFEQWRMSDASKEQLRSQLQDQMADIINNPDLTPEAKEAAIQNLINSINETGDAINIAFGNGDNFPDLNSMSDSDIDQILVGAANANGYSNPSLAELQAARQYVKSQNMTPAEMKAYVGDVLAGRTPSATSGGAQQPSQQQPQQQQQQSSGSSANDLVAMAKQYGYNATAEEAQAVIEYAKANGMTPQEVVMREMQARGLA